MLNFEDEDRTKGLEIKGIFQFHPDALITLKGSALDLILELNESVWCKIA